MKYRDTLPQLNGKTCLTDGGLETVLVFKLGIELPHFAAFTLLCDAAGRERLREYLRPYAAIACDHKFGMVLGAPTWRANTEWGRRLGYQQPDLDKINGVAIRVLEDIRTEHESPESPMPITGCIGPRGDGYSAAAQMSVGGAEKYHLPQVRVFAESPADLVSALTMTYPDEAIGIVNAAKRVGMPVVISFTVETDGLLPCGLELGEAIDRCDAETDGCIAYYMINCAHPAHVGKALERGGPWQHRLKGIRVNASARSHSELNEATELDEGDPEALAAEFLEVAHIAGSIAVFGGCCGTDERHLEEIARALSHLRF